MRWSSRWLLVVGVFVLGACARPQPGAPRPTSASPSATPSSLRPTPSAGPSSPTPATAPTLPPSRGRVFYVSPAGDDANPGTRERPWASPGAASRRLHSGDTLIILRGRYRLSGDDDILTPPSGTPDGWVTIVGEAGQRPVLVGSNNLLTAIDLSGARYVRVRGLEITHDDRASGQDGWFRDGIDILAAPAEHIVLEDLYIHHVDEFGINVQDVDDLQILNSRIVYAGFGALGGPAGAHGGWRHVVVRGCTLAYSGHYYRGGEGHDRPYDRPDGFGIEPSEGPILIENTVAAHNYGDGLDSKAARTTIRNSVVANNSCDGVKLWGSQSSVENTLIYGRGDGDATPTPWAAIVIDTTTPQAVFALRHVTVDDALGQNYLLYAQYDHPTVPITLHWENVIFASRGERASVYLAPAVDLQARGVLFFFPHVEAPLQRGEMLYDCQALPGLGGGLQCGDPRFVAPAWGEEGDYHLQAGSPAIDAGFSIGVTTDLEGRPRDAHPDLGAYEYQAADQ